MLHCEWGERRGKKGKEDWSRGDFSTWPGDLEKQVRILNDLLFDFECASSYDAITEVATLRISFRTSMALNELSVMKLRSRGNDLALCPATDAHLPYVQVRRGERHVEGLTVRLQYPSRSRNPVADAFSVQGIGLPGIAATVQRDIYGDGKHLVPLQAEVIKIRENDAWTKLKELFS